jgi:hypothetical protein
MKRLITKKSASILTALVLILALTITAFAAWPSFQNDNTNNGVVTTQPPITTPAVTPIALPTSGTIGTDVYSGVDATSVISDSGIAYTVYNGGISSGYNGGARLHATNLSTAATVFDIRLDANTNNVQQLSTPYLDGTTLYAATTFYTNQLATSGVTGWLDSSENPITGFDFPANATTTITYNGMVIPADFWEPQLMLTGISTTTGLSGALTLRNTDTGTRYPFTGSQYDSSTLTLYSDPTNPIIPAGTYDLSVDFTNSTSDEITAQNIQFLTSGWNLWSVDVGVAGTPLPVLLKTGYGQANTPISYGTTTIDNADVLFIYWGIYEGDRSYYQYNTTNGATVIFDPTDISYPADDFYGAGAVVVTVSGEDYAVFGGDGGYIYVCPVTAFNTSANNIQINGTPRIRSSVAVDSNETYVYFTGQNATLWQIPVASLTTATPTTPVSVQFGTAPTSTSVENSTSTPVISANGYIYVGSYGYDADFNGIGLVQAVAVNGFSPTSTVIDIYGTKANPLDPVQSSPIVWSVSEPNNDDYIYFTTNSGSGAGYCYRLRNGSTVSMRWTYANTSGNKYSVQGMASDGGHVVWGDDGNNLYIAP